MLPHAQVPAKWLKAYPSLKPLGAWTRDLLARITQLTNWIQNSYPTVYWLGGFTYPTGFLTAVLQVRCMAWVTATSSVVRLEQAMGCSACKCVVVIRSRMLAGLGISSDCLCNCTAQCGQQPLEHDSMEASCGWTQQYVCILCRPHLFLC